MNPNNYVPYLFVGIGEKSCFFTLRQSYLHAIHIPGEGSMGGAVVNGQYQGSTLYEERNFHLYNLSQDPDEAIEKATAASQELGLKMISSRDRLVDELNEIKRSTAAEIERREREAAAGCELWCLGITKAGQPKHPLYVKSGTPRIPYSEEFLKRD